MTRSDLAALLLAAAAATGIALVRPAVATRIERVKESSDVYALPPPDQLVVTTLGYRAAAADLIWAYVLVAQGSRVKERRRFDHAARYFESIVALDASYREPYLLVDAVLTFGAVRATADDVRAARRILEAGLAARPTDAQLHYQAGSFMAYLSPSYLQGDELVQWESDGARLLARAAELGLGTTSSRETLASASILNRSGQRDAAASILERAYELTDDQTQREEILRRLASLRGEAATEKAKKNAQRFESAWHADLPFVSRNKILLLGPAVDAFACSGSMQAPTRSCGRGWRTWDAER